MTFIVRKTLLSIQDSEMILNQNLKSKKGIHTRWNNRLNNDSNHFTFFGKNINVFNK